MIYIQIQDTYVWMTVLVLPSAADLAFHMSQVHAQYPTARVRAIAEDGRLLDLL